MQRYRIIHFYDYHIDTVTSLLMDSKVPIYDLADLPNVSTNKLLSEKDEGDKRYLKVEWCVHGQIPKIAQKIIRPEMLTFVEDSIWDRTTKTYSTKIIPHFFKKQFDARHKVEFTDHGDGRTMRVLTGHFDAKIPIVGPVFEQVVMKYLKQNAEEDFRISARSLDSYITKNGDPNADKSKKKH